MQHLTEWLPDATCEKRRREFNKNIDMARHFTEAMMGAGFAARDVALAFIACGIDLAENLGGTHSTLDLLHVIGHVLEMQQEKQV